MFVTNRYEISNLYRGPSNDAFYQMLVHLGKRFQRKRLSRNWTTRNKNCLWRPCLLTNQDEMRIRYRGHSIDVSFQIWVHLGKRLQRRTLFTNRPIRNKNFLWRRSLLTDQDEMNNRYRGPFQAACYQVSVYLVKRFQRRRFFRNRPIRNKNCPWRPCL